MCGDSSAHEREIITNATGGKPDIAVYDGAVVSAGRVEMLPFVREQAVSVTAHRFGTPNPRLTANLFVNDSVTIAEPAHAQG